jgi:hypothetical protein
MPKYNLNNSERHRPHRRLYGNARSFSRTGGPVTLLFVLVSLLVCGAPRAGASAPNLSADSEVATAGFYRLSWGPGQGPFELQEAADPEFRKPSTLYFGPDLATVISGRPDGTWHYRVRIHTNAGRSDWSNPVMVKVDHHDLSRALMFLSLGFVVFIAIVATVVRGKGAE